MDQKQIELTQKMIQRSGAMNVDFKFIVKDTFKDGSLKVGFYTDAGFFSEIWFYNRKEWQAFKTLLQPSKKADFTITEVDENGQPIK